MFRKILSGTGKCLSLLLHWRWRRPISGGRNTAGADTVAAVGAVSAVDIWEAVSAVDIWEAALAVATWEVGLAAVTAAPQVRRSGVWRRLYAWRPRWFQSWL